MLEPFYLDEDTIGGLEIDFSWLRYFYAIYHNECIRAIELVIHACQINTVGIHVND